MRAKMVRLFGALAAIAAANMNVMWLVPYCLVLVLA